MSKYRGRSTGAGTYEGKKEVIARLAANRLGVDLRSEHPRPARIRRAVRQVLDDPSTRTNVQRVRSKLDHRDALATVTAAVEQLGAPQRSSG